MSRRSAWALGLYIGFLSLGVQAQAPTQAPRFIALTADGLTKSGEAAAAADTAGREPEASWSAAREATVMNGATLTRESVSRLLSDPALRGRHVVLLLRGLTTAGPSGPPAWLVHSQRSGADALLDRERLITAADIRGWLARSGASDTVLFIEGGEGVETLCASLAAPKHDGLRLAAWCQRSDDAGAVALGPWLASLPGEPDRAAGPQTTTQTAAQWLQQARRRAGNPARVSLVFSGSFRVGAWPLPPAAASRGSDAGTDTSTGKGLGALALRSGKAAPVSYYLLRRGYTCRPPLPGEADVLSWVDRIEWSAGTASRWGSRCNDNGVLIEAGSPELRISSDGQLLIYREQRYVQLAQAPQGDGFEAKEATR